MLYIIEFFCAVLFIAGILLFGVFALSKIVAGVLAVILTVTFLRMDGAAKGLIFIGAGFLVAAAVTAGVPMLF